MDVTPASIEHRVGRNRVHPGRVVQQVDRLRGEANGRDDPDALLGEHVVGERFAGLAAGPDPVERYP